MAMGLKDCHIKQIVHYDIKHKNILISSKNKQLPKVKIADFGLAF